MPDSSYSAKVAKLLGYGMARSSRLWPNYVRDLDLREEDIDDLLRMAGDPALANADSESPEASAPLHAWRALGQLGAFRATGPLLEIVESTEDDWQLGEIPRVIGLFGKPALATLATWLADETHNERVTYGVVLALVEVTRTAPETRTAIIPLLTNRLEKYRDNDFAVNAYLVEALCTLKAKQALPLVKEVYEKQRADLTIIHWDQVLDALGD